MLKHGITCLLQLSMRKSHGQLLEQIYWRNASEMQIFVVMFKGRLKPPPRTALLKGKFMDGFVSEYLEILTTVLLGF